MGNDMTLPCGDGFVNIRVGALIQRGEEFLVMGNPGNDYLYSVGGRVQLGETTEQAILREVFEETGVHMEIDRLGFVHEDYYYNDLASRLGKLTYELSFYYYMKVPEDFHPVAGSCTEENRKEFLVWIRPEDPRRIYPDFFHRELKNPVRQVKHIITDSRI